MTKKEFFHEFSNEYDINKKILEILVNRGIAVEDIHEFIFSEEYPLAQAEGLKGIKEGRDRVIKAIRNHEEILIYGDYDADGITSTALIYKALKRLKAKVKYFIPNRLTDGYGLCDEAVEKNDLKEVKLLITVDCGIKSVDIVEKFKAKNVDVIITDHHTPEEVIPDCIVINPKVDRNKDFYDLAGVGVAFQLIQSLQSEFEELQDMEEELLQLVAIGSIADIVPLLGENRKLTKKGLKHLREKPILGMKLLLEKSKIHPREVDSDKIAYNLAPLINSSGRMADPKLALELMISDDKEALEERAEELVGLNKERKKIVEEIYQDAKKEIMKNHLYQHPVILVASNDYHIGVLGIVAAKIQNEYNRPAIVLTSNDGKLFKGSARSIPSFNIYDALFKQKYLMTAFGGHAQAAGLSIEEDNIGLLREKLNQEAYEVMERSDFLYTPKADLEIDDLGDIDLHFYEQLKKLDPFGAGNKKPVFMLDQPKIMNSKRIGKMFDHLKLEFASPKGKVNGIYFNFAQLVDHDSKCRVYFTPEKNVWCNRESLQVNVLGIESEKNLIEKFKVENIYDYYNKFEDIDKKISIKSIGREDIFDIIRSGNNIVFAKEIDKVPEQLRKRSIIIDRKSNYEDKFEGLKKYVMLENQTILTNLFIKDREILKTTQNCIFLDHPYYDNYLRILGRLNPDTNILKAYGDGDVDTREIRRLFPDRCILGEYYLNLKKIVNGSEPLVINISKLIDLLSGKMKKNIKKCELLSCLNIFTEIDLLNAKLKNDYLEIHFASQMKKNDLMNSEYYYNMVENTKVID